MKRTLVLIVLLAILVQPGMAYTPAVAPQESVEAAAAAMGAAEEPAPSASGVASTPAQENPEPGPGGMPGWPLPAKPIPHHEPGHLSRAGGYTTQVVRENERGVQEVVEISGVDAMAADGVDPLAGNYTMVDLDKIMMSWNVDNQQSVQTFSSTLEIMPDSQSLFDNYRSLDIAAGDVNGDGQAEQIVAWLDPADSHIRMSIGEMPGSLGRTTSAPAAIAGSTAQPDGWALQFDGSDDYVNAGGGIDLANSSFTVAFWAKRGSTGTDDFAIGHGAGGENQGLHIGFLGANNNRFRCSFHANDLDTPEGYTDTDWHHWACTYDAGTNRRTIYRDGVQVARDNPAEAYQGSGELHIGRYLEAFRSFHGLIDEVGVWTIAHTEEQIQTDMNRWAPDEEGLLAYWHFDEGSGTTAEDASGNLHGGTLVNEPVWDADDAPLGEGELHLLARGYDEALWHCVYDVDTRTCLSWDNSAGGTLLSAPAVASVGDGQFDVFAVGTDNQVWQSHWSGGVWAGWTKTPTDTVMPDVPPWTGPTPELPAPAAVARDGGIDLFRLGPDNTLRWNHFNGTAWGEWQSLGGMLASGPGAVSLGAGHMQVFARGVDETLWYRTYSSEAWGDWQRVGLDGMEQGVTIASAPTAVSTPLGQIEVYVRGSDDQLWQITFNGTSWGPWLSLGGQVASGAAVAAGNIFAQADDGSLQHSADGLGWAPMGGLNPCCAIFDTGLAGVIKDVFPYRDYSLDVETGYFLGDGRAQIVLAYHPPEEEVAVTLFEVGGGFQPILTRSISMTHSLEYFSIATGDFLDADGIDEVALAYVDGNKHGLDIISLAEDPHVAVLSHEESDNSKCYKGRLMQSAGTLEVASGDLDDDGQDEIAMTAVFYCWDVWGEQTSCKTYRYHFHNRVFDILQPTNEGSDPELRAFHIGEEYDVLEGLRNALHPWQVGLALAVGDPQGDGQDEIIRTWPVEFDTDECGLIPVRRSDYFKRKLQIFQLPSNEDAYRWSEDAFKKLASQDLGVEGYTWNSYVDRLAVGDLDRDLAEEIVWQFGTNADRTLRTYDYNAGAKKFDDPLERSSEFVFYPNLVTADFTGEGLRVGPPSYRVQNRVDTLVTHINAPPKHRDWVKDAEGNYKLIWSPACDSSDPACTHAKYEQKDFTESKQTITTQHAYEISAGMENEFCAGGGVQGIGEVKACARQSIDYTHGGNFEKSTEEIASVEFTQRVIAADDDQLVYFGTPYGVWEYPVLAGAAGQPSDEVFITVAFPLIESTQNPSTSGGYHSPTCDERWYSADHQLNNVWSYDPKSDPPTFKDYDPEYNPAYIGAHDDNFTVEITQLHENNDFKSVSFAHAISAGLEREVSAAAKIKVVDLNGSFQARVGGEYSYTGMETDKLTTSEETTFICSLAPQPEGSKFTTRVIFYRAKDGYEVLNYQAEPGSGTGWDLYKNIADPAFILPWYGFPDPDDPTKSEPPPCGEDQKLFSPSIVISPTHASLGEVVNISASVRNFSNEPTGDVLVRFYQGDPANNIVIGEDTIPSFYRKDGPKEASITWHAAGVGEQKIYAVIDPENSIEETHDEDDLINNNVGYGLVRLSSTAFADMALAAGDPPYDAISYAMGASGSYAMEDSGPTVSLYVPRASLDAVARFEVGATEVGPPIEGPVFEVTAYQGSSSTMWGEPIADFDLQPEENDPPAVVSIAYGQAETSSLDENELKLYRLVGITWEEATCSGYQIHHFPEQDLISAPICVTGIFALSATAPGPTLAPKARFNAEPTSGLAPLTVDFKDRSRNYPALWFWDFGDGSDSTKQHPLPHTYAVPGSFTVSLTVSNTVGSNTLVVPDCIVVHEGERIYLPLVVRKAP